MPILNATPAQTKHERRNCEYIFELNEKERELKINTFY